MDEKKRDVQSFDLEDKHVELLSRYSYSLKSYYISVGSQLCKLLQNVDQAQSLEKTLETLQDDISKELKLPRGERLNWLLEEKKVEVVN